MKSQGISLHLWRTEFEKADRSVGECDFPLRLRIHVVSALCSRKEAGPQRKNRLQSCHARRLRIIVVTQFRRGNAEAGEYDRR